jgi:hypothetical protein
MERVGDDERIGAHRQSRAEDACRLAMSAVVKKREAFALAEDEIRAALTEVAKDASDALLDEVQSPAAIGGINDAFAAH